MNTNDSNISNLTTTNITIIIKNIFNIFIDSDSYSYIINKMFFVVFSIFNIVDDLN